MDGEAGALVGVDVGEEGGLVVVVGPGEDGAEDGRGFLEGEVGGGVVSSSSSSLLLVVLGEG